MILRCALCPAFVAVRDAAHPTAPTLDQVDSYGKAQLGWASSSDGKVLCPRHAPRAPVRPLKDAIPTGPRR